MTWWQYRRRRWFAVFVAGLLLILGMNLLGSSGVELVIYNDGVESIGSLHLTIGKIRIEISALAAGESQLRVLPNEVSGELVVWVPREPPEQVGGPWVDAGELSQVIIRVDDFGNVTFSTMPSWRMRISGWLQ